MEPKKRVEEVMKSIEGMQRAKAPRDGFAKIQEKLAEQNQLYSIKEKQGNLGWLQMAAVILLVLSSNIWVLSNYMESEGNTTQANSGYTELVTDFNLYENE